MTSYSNGGFFNAAYHDSETLEVDRRYSNKSHHTNPYPRDDPAWQGDRAETHDGYVSQTTGSNEASARVPWRDWQGESWRGRESIPMGLISELPGALHGSMTSITAHFKSTLTLSTIKRHRFDFLLQCQAT
ncbi:unnamed protein product [Pleuronectes platessa]|uniref:Uncharacterized protein n=1 Tax=Pleuronectes platessa TaxID=8262 RepID=A0A9N7VIQ9_PLEPL|nr:unnamed protein product [Pleuronectes platessa]